MRRLLKFLHTMGSAGLLGAMASLVVMLSLAPAPSALAGYAAMRGAMGAVATWIFLPALAVTLMSGLLAMALNRAFLNAGWAWLKLATGVLMFEGGLVYVQGPMKQEAEQSARALAGLVEEGCGTARCPRRLVACVLQARQPVAGEEARRSREEARISGRPSKHNY